MRRRRLLRTGAALVAVLVGSAVPIAPVVSAQSAGPSGFAAACPADTPEDGFVDVAADNVHESSVDCAWSWRVVRGTGVVRYSPEQTLTRGQAATIGAKVLAAAAVPLPDAAPDAFDDDDATTHEGAGDQLSALGIMRGDGERTFAPTKAVTRGQAASIVVSIYEARSGTTLPTGPDAFVDDTGSVHEDSINRAFAAGLLRGRTPSAFDPSAPLRRDQMASIIARVLDRFVRENLAQLPCEQRSTEVFQVAPTDLAGLVARSPLILVVATTGRVARVRLVQVPPSSEDPNGDTTAILDVEAQVAELLHGSDAAGPVVGLRWLGDGRPSCTEPARINGVALEPGARHLFFGRRDDETGLVNPAFYDAAATLDEAGTIVGGGDLLQSYGIDSLDQLRQQLRGLP